MESIKVLLFSLLGQVFAYSALSVAVAYGAFRWFAKSWLENKFKEKLAAAQHEYNKEIQRLKARVDAMGSGVIRLHQKEFEVLPEAWGLLDNAVGLVSWITHPMQSYPKLRGLNSEELEEFLAGTEFRDSHKKRIREAGDKDKIYQDLVFRYRAGKVQDAIRELQNYVARNVIFLKPELSKAFTEVSQILWSAMVAKEVGHEASDWKLQGEGWKKLEEQAKPLHDSIRDLIEKRLNDQATLAVV